MLTMPLPVPAKPTLRVAEALNIAVTDCTALTLTVHAPVPAQPPPLQPVNVEPEAGVAVRVTMVPEVNAWEQVGAQLIPAGELTTVPVPEPV